MTMTVGRRIAFGFGAVLLLILGMGYYQYARLNEILGVTERLTSGDIALARLLSKFGESNNDLRRQLDRSVIAFFLAQTNANAQVQRESLAVITRARQATEARLQEIIRFVEPRQHESVSSDRSQAWQGILEAMRSAESHLQEMGDGLESVFSAIEGNRPEAVAAALPAVDAARAAFRDKLDTAEEMTQSLARAGQDNMLDTVASAQDVLIALIGAAAIVGGLISVFITRSITQPLGTYMKFVEQVGQGDLSNTIPGGRRDELGLMGNHLNAMVNSIRSVAQQTREAAENLNAAAAEALASTQQQNASVEEQYAAVQETTATLSEITQSGAQIRERAKQVADSAESAARTSNVGIDSIRDTASAMDMIRDQAEAVAENIVALSEKTTAISEIISTVNDIAERSHLLALNAAIEAASAGESGRGFTVVANEIKNLADQAKEATGQVRANLSEIQQGINSSVMLTEEAVKRVVSGKSKSDSAQQTIHELSESVQRSVEAFQQILAATNQQQIGLEQVSQALQNIRFASEQTSAGANQVEKAATNLNALGEQLLRAAGKYKW